MIQKHKKPNWKEIAAMLYEELIQAATYSGEGCWAFDNEDYDKAIQSYQDAISKNKKS